MSSLIFRVHFCLFSLYRISRLIFSSAELLGSSDELIVQAFSGVISHPPFSRIIFYKTPWPIKAKFYVEPPLEGGTKMYLNSPSQKTKMAAMPLYVF